MVARNTAVARQRLVHLYDDGPGGRGATEEKERAFREGFLGEARRVIRVWADPPEELQPRGELKVVRLSAAMKKVRFNSRAEIETAWELRQDVREQHCVYRRGSAGPKTHLAGYRMGHEVPAAHARGRHHALEYVIEPWRDAATASVDVFDSKLLRPWLAAVERWAAGPMRPETPMPPPRLMEVASATVEDTHLVPLSMNLDKPALACPVCGADYVHPVAVECRSPGQANGHLRVDSRGVHLNPTVPQDGRGVVITLTFHCENGHLFTYRMTFHKGMTFLERTMVDTPREAGPWPETIWRN
jgi:hypothetical protein